MLRGSVEVACGPSSMVRRVRGIEAPDDLAIYIGDLDKVDLGSLGLRVFKVVNPGFSNRAVYIGGLPHVSLEDYLASMVINDEYYVGLLRYFNLRHVDWKLVEALMANAGLANLYVKVREAADRFNA